MGVGLYSMTAKTNKEEK